MPELKKLLNQIQVCHDCRSKALIEVDVMSKKSIEEQHSDTAMVAAAFRAVAHREFANSIFGSDDLARHFIPPFQKFLIKFKTIRNLGIKRHNKYTPGGFAYVVARTAFFDRIFVEAVKSGTTQIVLVGAGYDTRAYRYANLCADCKVIELDIETTQARKKHCLERAGIAIPGNITFAPINFNRDSLSNILLNAGYDASEKTLFLWEGVSMYLEKEAVNAMLQFVSACRHQESLIVFDYIASIRAEDVHSHYGVKTWQETWRKYRQAEPFKFDIDETRIKSFLRDRGLNMQSHWLSVDIENQFLPYSNAEDLAKVAGWFRFVTASPA